MEFSRITDGLFIGTTPRVEDYDTLRSLGVRLVINMRFDRRLGRDPHVPPLDFLWLRTFDTPFLPIPIPLLVRGARLALKTIHGGGGVYIHCLRGRHRGVAMGAAVLVALGFSQADAIELIKRQRPIADPDAFHIRSRICRFALAWRHSGNPAEAGSE